MWECAGRLVLSGLILFSLSPFLSDIMVNNPSPVSRMPLEVQVVRVSEWYESFGRIFYSALILYCFHPLHQNNNWQVMNIVVGSDGTERQHQCWHKNQVPSQHQPLHHHHCRIGLVTLCVTAALPRPLIIADVNIIARVTPLALNKADNLVIMCVQFHIWCMRAVAIKVYYGIVCPRWVIFDNDIFWPRSDRKVVIMGTAANTVRGHG